MGERENDEAGGTDGVGSRSGSAGKKDCKSAPDPTVWDETERRRCPRVQLDKPCFATLHIEGMESYSVMLTDIGSQGAQVLLPPQLEPTDVPDGAKLFLYGFPAELEGLANRELEGTLAWRGVRNCGIAFSEPLEMRLEEFITFDLKL